MTMTTKTKRVRCPGCGNRMNELTKPNRDQQGESWHLKCLGNHVSAQLRARSALGDA